MRCPIFALVWLALAAGTAAAQSPTPTCVEVTTAREDAAGLRRLVISELDRHSTHHAVEDGCISHLRVEVVEVAEGKYLTARLNEQVPVREHVEEGDLEDAVVRLLKVTLHNDPVRLYGPDHDDWLRTQREIFRRRGVNLYGAEAFQMVTRVDGELTGLPGVAAVARREVDAWHLGVRLSGAFMPDPPREHARLTAVVAANLELSLFASAEADTSPYVTALVGLQHQRVSGPAPGNGEGAHGVATATGGLLGLRGGVEMFRTADTRVDFFLEFDAPLFTASDEDGRIIDQWLPTASLGAGVSF